MQRRAFLTAFAATLAAPAFSGLGRIDIHLSQSITARR